MYELKQCENCQQPHDCSYGSGRFCSIKCARGFSTKLKRKEISEKVSKKLNERARVNPQTITLTCQNCQVKFVVIYTRRKQICCSRICSGQFSQNKPERKAQQRAYIKQRVNNGTWKGWETRNKLSYPEQFWITVLKVNNLFDKVKINYPVKKRSLGIECDANYFLDFFFPDLMGDLEIDGKQHEFPDRKLSDTQRDIALTLAGYSVYRIKWKSINSDVGKQYIENEITKFLKFIRDIA